MINLSTQLNLIIFSLIYGFMFSIMLDVMYSFTKKIKRIYQIVISFFVVLLMSIIYFVGIDKIGYIIFHVYSILCIIIGFISYDLIIKKLANKYKK